MSDEAAFLRAARAQPDDDTLRLVYADWLEEQGGEKFTTQAAFVRLQVWRSRLDVFDPDRAGLLEQEAKLIQKHKRDWNGRIHHALHRRGLFGLIDSRRGLIRKWDYHRGMIARVSLPADGLAAHADFVASLGPLQALELIGWPDWSKTTAHGIGPLFAGLKVLSLRFPGPPLTALTGFAPLRHVAVLDLRSVPVVASAALHWAARVGELPPVMLLRQTAMVPRPTGGTYIQQNAFQAVHVIDPHGKWDALRLWFADFTGEVLNPIRV